MAGLRGGAVRGLNVTVPFKGEALALADRADVAAQAAGAANLLLFEPDGAITARNTDGVGMLAALAEQAPGWSVGAGPAVILGAGGAAQGAAAALQGKAELLRDQPHPRPAPKTSRRGSGLAPSAGTRWRRRWTARTWSSTPPRGG